MISEERMSEILKKYGYPYNFVPGGWKDAIKQIAKESHDNAIKPQWLPIESAPLHTPLIVYENGTVEGVIVCFDGENWYFNESGEMVDDFRPAPFNPSHWMPLPEPPK